MKQGDLFARPHPPDEAPRKATATGPQAPAGPRGATAAPAGSRGATAAPPGPGAPAAPGPRGAAVTAGASEAGPAAAVGARAAGAPAAGDPAAARTQAGPRVLTVGEITRVIKDAIEPRLARVLVRGEVSGFRGPNARGHLYFAIKDAAAALDVKMWAGTAGRLRFALKDGLAVVVEGYVQVYEPQGRYSLIASRIEPEGQGALALAFEQLKARLLAEGLFGDKRTKPKVPPPFLPRRIGVATSLSGAALRDFLKVLHRRHPRLAVLVCDARVQGEGASADVARAIRWLGRTDVDVIVVTRGGGSVEDLWAFNEEPVVRAIFEARVPVVSAIGHEVDVTLADLVADVRAPTPSAAAELLAPSLEDLELGLAQARRRLLKAAERRTLEARHALQGLRRGLGDPRRHLSRARVELGEGIGRAHRGALRAVRERRAELAALSTRLARLRPQAQLQATREQAQALGRRLQAAAFARLRREQGALADLKVRMARESPRPRLQTERAALSGLAERLDALSPLKVLGRGYAIARRTRDGRLVRSAADVQVGDELSLRLAQDTLAAKVTKK